MPCPVVRSSKTELKKDFRRASYDLTILRFLLMTACQYMDVRPVPNQCGLKTLVKKHSKQYSFLVGLSSLHFCRY